MRVIRGFGSRGEVEELLELARAAAFVPGRQGTGYEKHDLGTGSLGARLDALTRRSLEAIGSPVAGRWDRWILRYREGAWIPAHVDPPSEEGVAHIRLNMLLAAGTGGALRIDGELVLLEVGDAVIFRPDSERHEVARLESGERLVWSVGGYV